MWVSRGLVAEAEELTILADRRPGSTLSAQGVVGEMAPKLVPWDLSPRYGRGP